MQKIAEGSSVGSCEVSQESQKDCLEKHGEMEEKRDAQTERKRWERKWNICSKRATREEAKETDNVEKELENKDRNG